MTSEARGELNGPSTCYCMVDRQRTEDKGRKAATILPEEDEDYHRPCVDPIGIVQSRLILGLPMEGARLRRAYSGAIVF